MKVTKFVIKYSYPVERDGFVCPCLFGSFEEAMAQLINDKEHAPIVFDKCNGVLIKCIEFDV